MTQISREIVKIFIKTKKYYIFSRKKAYGQRSNGLLELIGGHVESGETPLEALLREVQEEEETGILANLLVNIKLPPTEVTVAVNGIGELHYIYYLNVSEEDSKKLKASNDESYGFEFIKTSLVETKKGLVKLRTDLTWKTNEIFSGLGKR